MSIDTPDQPHDQPHDQPQEPEPEQQPGDQPEDSVSAVRERDARIRELETQLAAATAPGPVAHDPHADKRPWAVALEHASEEHTRDVAPLPYRGPGAVLHRFPHLTGGSGGPQDGPYVRALAELLAEAGYTSNEVINGRQREFDNSMMADVRRFQADNDVRENTDAYHGHPHPAEQIVRNLVGPYTVQALFEKVADKRGEPVHDVIREVEHRIERLQPHPR